MGLTRTELEEGLKYDWGKRFALVLDIEDLRRREREAVMNWWRNPNIINYSPTQELDVELTEME